MRLLIVESPAKCSTIQSYLGSEWCVMASYGHMRALAEKLDAVGIDNNWTPIYEELERQKERIAKLRRAAKDAAEVWIATDDDREGSGIGWHLCHILKLNPATTNRIVFHEITKSALQAAVASPQRLDMNLVNAQQARAMLDMLVGFTISRCVGKRVAPKLSAGRCQSPALRLVVERDTEIANHSARNFWKLRATLATSNSKQDSEFPLAIGTPGEFEEAKAREVLRLAASASSAAAVTIRSIRERVATSNAPAPLITSTLQQEASSLHGLNPKATMMAAQKLYELGHITYMRTDNPILSGEAAGIIRGHIAETWGAEFVGPEGQHQGAAATTSAADGETPETATKETKKPKKKSAKDAKQAAEGATGPVEAQAAHEAIRPTHPEVRDLPDLEHSQQVVYRLIWRRAIQSQMSASKTQVRIVFATIDSLPDLCWSGEQTRPVFDGWRIVEKTEKVRATEAADVASWDHWTPHCAVDHPVVWTNIGADETFTKPPGRFTEATLIRELEKRGIGRPSTFASIVTTLFDREYIETTNKEGKLFETRHVILAAGAKAAKESKQSHKAGVEKNKIAATALGVSVSDYLLKDFADLFDYEFTARMESALDEIAKGHKEWKTILQETWDSYKDRYAVVQAERGTGGRTIVGTEAGTKVIQTKKGPLLVRPKADGSGDEFASLPSGITAANAAEKLTSEVAEAAFVAATAAKEGEIVGMWDSHEMRKKKGPYGFYVESDGVKVPWKAEDTETTLMEKLTAKKCAFERKVGDWTIKQGPYGLYYYKHTLNKMVFHKFPKEKDAETITAEELLKAASEKPKPASGKPKGAKKD